MPGKVDPRRAISHAPLVSGLESACPLQGWDVVCLEIPSTCVLLIPTSSLWGGFGEVVALPQCWSPAHLQPWEAANPVLENPVGPDLGDQLHLEPQCAAHVAASKTVTPAARAPTGLSKQAYMSQCPQDTPLSILWLPMGCQPLSPASSQPWPQLLPFPHPHPERMRSLHALQLDPSVLQLVILAH